MNDRRYKVACDLPKTLRYGKLLVLANCAKVWLLDSSTRFVERNRPTARSASKSHSLYKYSQVFVYCSH